MRFGVEGLGFEVRGSCVVWGYNPVCKVTSVWGYTPVYDDRSDFTWGCIPRCRVCPPNPHLLFKASPSV